MTGPGQFQRYQIVVQGDCRKVLLGLIERIQAELCQCGNTIVIASVRDRSEFWGLIYQLEDLVLHLISLHELTNGEGQPTPHTCQPPG